MAPVKSVSFLDIWNPKWQKFVNSFSTSNIFHSSAWISLIAETYNFTPKVIVVRDRDNNIKVGLPFIEIQRVFGRMKWVTLPFSDHYEILYKDQEAVNDLANALDHQIENHHLEKIEIRCDFPRDSWTRIASQYVVHTLSLDEDSEKVQKRVHSMHQRNIRKALSNNLRVEWGNSLDHMRFFYRLHLDTRRRQGVPIQPWRFFKCLLEQLIDKDMGFVLLVYEKNECVAGAIFLHWGITLTYKYGASLLKAQKSRANNLLMWSAIQWGCSNGCKVLDLGRTDINNKGLRSYKSRWGAQELPLVYMSSSDQASNHRSQVFLNIAETVIRRSPPGVCRLSGELFYKFFA